MTDSERDFWQREAARFETSVHVNLTRTYALVGAGLAALAAVSIGIFTTGHRELILLVPLLVVMLWLIALGTVQEVLVKALYQYRAEKKVASYLPPEERSGFFTWEDLGGRIGTRTFTTQTFWALIALLSVMLEVGALWYFYSVNVAVSAPEPNAAVQWVAALSIAGVFSLVIIVSMSLMYKRYEAIKVAFGYDKDLTIDDVLTRALLVAHPQATIDGDDSAGDVGSVVAG